MIDKYSKPGKNGPVGQKRMKENTGKALAVLLALMVWQILAMVIHQQILLVTPLQVLLRLGTIWKEADFWSAIWFSFSRITAGFFLGLFLGMLLAFAAARVHFVEVLLWPWMTAIRTVPIASFVVICLVWLSSGRLSVFISFLVVLPIIYQNLLEGLKNADKSLEEMAAVFRLTPGRRLRYILIPELRPYLVSACKVTIGMAWKAGIAAEIIGAPKGSMGHMLYISKIYLDTDDLLAWTVIIVLISVLFEKLFMKVLIRLLAPVPEAGKERAEGAGRTETPRTEDPRKEAASEEITSEEAASEEITSEEAAAEEITSEEITSAENIRLSDITKSYNGMPVLKNLNLELAAGACTVLMGPSGAGKTTLLRILLGLEEAKAGSITGAPGKKAAVFQEDRLCDEFSVYENIALVLKDRKQEDQIPKHLKMVGLEECRNMPVCKLSGGMKRRVALVRAVMADSDLILLDEPFKGLDENCRRQAVRYFMQQTAGKTTLVVTHDPEEGAMLGGNVLELDTLMR